MVVACRYWYEVTDGFLMVSDLQGVRTAEGYTLTDPVILCEDLKVSARRLEAGRSPRAARPAALGLLTHHSTLEANSCWCVTPGSLRDAQGHKG